MQHSNGSTHHRSEASVDNPVAAGLGKDADRGDPTAVDAEPCGWPICWRTV
jgi:hypothetical protein